MLINKIFKIYVFKTLFSPKQIYEILPEGGQKSSSTYQRQRHDKNGKKINKNLWKSLQSWKIPDADVLKATAVCGNLHNPPAHGLWRYKILKKDKSKDNQDKSKNCRNIYHFLC